MATVAALVVDDTGDQTRVLLVRTSSGRRWTFPKGTVRKRETGASAAVRETAEEAGVACVPVGDRPVARYRHDGRAVELYLCASAGRSGGHEPGRDPTFFTVDDALAALTSGRRPDRGAARHGGALAAGLAAWWQRVRAAA